MPATRPAWRWGTWPRTWSAQRFASVDPEEFYDFTVTRPEVRIAEGSQRRIEWPVDRAVGRRPARPSVATSCCSGGSSPSSSGAPSAPPWSGVARAVRRRAGGHARSPAGRRPPHPARAGLGHGPRSGPGRPPRTPAPRPTRARRASSGSSMTRAAGPDCRRRRCGRPFPTTSPRSRRRRRRWPWWSARPRWSGTHVDPVDLRAAAIAYVEQVSERVADDDEAAAYVAQLEEADDLEQEDVSDRCRVATPWPPRWSASSATSIATSGTSAIPTRGPSGRPPTMTPTCVWLATPGARRGARRTLR